MPYLADGTVTESALSRTVDFDSALKVGQVTEVHYVDANRSRRWVEYDVLVTEDRSVAVKYSHVRSIDSYGAANNFSEEVLTASKDELRLGSWVLIGCLYGNKSQAVILKCVQNPHLRAKTDKTPVGALAGKSAEIDERLKKLPTVLPGAKKDDGQRMLGEFVGVRWNINKEGELTILVQGPKDDAGKLTTDAGPSLLKFNKDGEILFLDKLDQEILISPKTGKIALASGNGDSIVIDRKASKISIATKEITEDAKANHTQTTGGNWTVTVTGNAKIEAVGNVEVKGTLVMLNNNGQLGRVLTDITDPVVDSIFGVKTLGVPTVTAG